MTAKINLIGVYGDEITLANVMTQYLAYKDKDVTDVEIYINSNGGSVEEGESINEYIQEIKATHTVNTLTDKAYSMAASTFALGENRIVYNIPKAAMIHLPLLNGITGNSFELKEASECLEETDKEFSKFYAVILGITESSALNLLKTETFLSGEEAVNLGLATELKEPLKAIASYTPRKPKGIKKEIKKEFKMSKIFDIIGKFKRDLSALDTNALVVLQDANGDDISFPDVVEGESPKVGDKATIGGKSVEGSYIMPSLDGITLVIAEGIITEIIPKADDDAVDPIDPIDTVNITNLSVGDHPLADGQIITVNEHGDINLKKMDIKEQETTQAFTNLTSMITDQFKSIRDENKELKKQIHAVAKATGGKALDSFKIESAPMNGLVSNEIDWMNTKRRQLENKKNKINK